MILQTWRSTESHSDKPLIEVVYTGHSEPDFAMSENSMPLPPVWGPSLEANCELHTRAEGRASVSPASRSSRKARMTTCIYQMGQLRNTHRHACSSPWTVRTETAVRLLIICARAEPVVFEEVCQSYRKNTLIQSF
ncbi:SUR7 family protein pun1 [Fusarium oxysporum f. sp. albedinis]|nr:SUR7 family protein pun1 [Fusarium oxysporum f. sp. albedinis]